MTSLSALVLFASISHQQIPYASYNDFRLRNLSGKPPSLSAIAERKGRDLLVHLTLTNNGQDEVDVPPFSMQAISPTFEEKISGRQSLFKEHIVPSDGILPFHRGFYPEELVRIYPGNRVSFDFLVEGFYSVNRRNYFMTVFFEEDLADSDGTWKGTFEVSTDRLKLP